MWAHFSYSSLSSKNLSIKFKHFFKSSLEDILIISKSNSLSIFITKQLLNIDIFTNYEYSELPPILRLETEFSKAAKEQTNVSPLRAKNLEYLEQDILKRVNKHKHLRNSSKVTRAIDTTKQQY